MIGPDNLGAVSRADCIVITVQPGQMDTVLEEISSGVDPERHGVITVATGVRLERLRSFLGEDVSLVRAMPNTAVETMSSMTCLTADRADDPGLEVACFVSRTHAGGRPVYNAKGLHHHRSERVGTPRIQLGNDPGDLDVESSSGRARMRWRRPKTSPRQGG